MLGAVIANSQRAPYTLKAESAEEAREWAQAIEMHAPRILQMRGGAVKESTGEEGATETMMPRGGPLQGIEEGDEEQSVDGSVFTETGRESSLGAGGAESSEVLLPLEPAPAPEPMARQQRPMEIPDEEDEWSGLMPHRGEPEPEPERVRQPAVSQPEEASRVVEPEPEPETGPNLDLDRMRVSTAVPAGERP